MQQISKSTCPGYKESDNLSDPEPSRGTVKGWTLFELPVCLTETAWGRIIESTSPQCFSWYKNSTDKTPTGGLCPVVESVALFSIESRGFKIGGGAFSISRKNIPRRAQS